MAFEEQVSGCRINNDLLIIKRVDCFDKHFVVLGIEIRVIKCLQSDNLKGEHKHNKN